MCKVNTRKKSHCCVSCRAPQCNLEPTCIFAIGRPSLLSCPSCGNVCSHMEGDLVATARVEAAVLHMHGPHLPCFLHAVPGKQETDHRDTERETAGGTEEGQTGRDIQTDRDRHRDSHTDRHKDRHKDRDRQTDTQTETDRHTDRHRDRHRDRRTDRHRDRETERQEDRETERQRDREAERQTDRQTDLQVCGSKGQLLLSTISLKGQEAAGGSAAVAPGGYHPVHHPPRHLLL